MPLACIFPTNSNLTSIHPSCLCESFGIQLGYCEIPVHSKPRRVILSEQAHTQATDLLAMVLAAEMEIASYPWEIGFSPVWLGPVISIICHGTQEKSGPLQH